ncbi:hypothetical protein [uncultured Microbacterium sp.]|uniref:hypothetical protein n=1 Tax=uncultured Microbacterium sp. TaxID=191216 RepID=UPI0026127838|nr:hypothetical protein [uncultured Microbacterium sp.]
MQVSGDVRAHGRHEAGGLFATAEGLGLKVSSAALSPTDALAARDAQLSLNGIG